MRFVQSIGKKGFITFSFNGKLLYSNYDPEKEAVNFVSKSNNIKKIVISICGYDFVNNALINNKNVEQILSFDPENFPIANKSNIIKRFSNISDLKEYILKSEIKSEEISFITWPPIIETNPEKYLNYLNELKYLFIKTTLNTINQNTFKKLEIRNIKINISKLKKIDVIGNKNISPLYPILIISSGNSLQNNIELIRDLYKKTIIIAYPSALAYLASENITPDYVIAVDPGYGTFYHLNKYRNKTNLITTLSITPSVINLDNYKLLFFNYGSDLENKLFNTYDVIKSNPEGSVIFNLLRILTNKGFNKIVLFGQDFSYMNNKSHISGGLFEDEFLYKSNFIETYESFVFNHDVSQLKTTINIGKKILTTTTALAIYYKHFMDKITEFPVFITENTHNNFEGKVNYIKPSELLNLPDISNRNIFLTTEVELKEKCFVRK